MEKKGITRRIDNLGRVVIPKEIRKNLRIHDNDELLIDVSDDNIVLSRYEKISNDIVLDNLVLSASCYLKSNVLITSKDSVIASSNRKFNNLLLSNSLVKKIINNSVIQSINVSSINLFGEVINCSYVILPFSVSSNVVGSVIIFDKNNLNNQVLTVISFLANFLENYLEED